MNILETARLNIRSMSVADAAFMLELLNEPGWLRFIGDRGVRTIADAQNYILHGPVDMLARLGYAFYVVELKETQCAIGICGLAKRDYLDDVDVGFALLAAYTGMGYGYESASAVLVYAKNTLELKRVVATTRLDNTISVKLLAKLGLRFERIMMHPDGDRELLLFGVEFI